jgi:ribonuclease H / adenosylcobalamin/alpha-ribazole phosphatase
MFFKYSPMGINTFYTLHKKHFFKFAIVGGVSTIFNYAFFYLLLKYLEVNYLVSSGSGYILGVFIGFYLNKFFTFESKSLKYGVELIKYFLVYGISLGISLFILKGLVFFGLNILIANILIIGLTTIINYFGSKYFVFAKSKIIKDANYLIYKYRYFLRYVLIGVISIFFELFIVLALGIKVPLKYLLPFAFLGGMIFSFILNLKFNFNISKNESFKAFFLFALISIFIYSSNLLLIKFFSIITPLNYSISRLISSAILFTLSYALHRKITFKNTKKVGVAIYLKKEEDVSKIKERVGNFIDWIHVDLVDSTIRKDSLEVDLSKGAEIKENWPHLKIMTHIMSKTPSKWIEKVSSFSDYIIISPEKEELTLKNLSKIKSLGKKSGICVMAKEEIKINSEVLKNIDILQILGIDHPGASGQEINSEVFLKIEKLNNFRKKSKYNFEICLDGGIKESNANEANAKYIVSGSTILNSDDPKNTIYNLKTGIKEKENQKFKIFLETNILKILGENKHLKSGTIVGSFVDKKGIEGISDLDIVVVLDKLDKNKFENLKMEFNELGKIVSKNWGYKTKLNMTFGPLKYNEDKTVVFHLMVYDIKSHIRHCMESPFTCNDWARSKVNVGAPIKEIWNPEKLRPRDFFSSRRSIEDYLRDLENGVISYREYKFINSKVKEELKFKKMSNKDKFEFSYHIMKFCISNFLKLYYHENKSLGIEKNIKKYFELFPRNRYKYEKYLRGINSRKIKNNYPSWSEKDQKIIRRFLIDFKSQFESYFYQQSRKIFFMRHQKTEMNKKKVFLGQKLNPPIIPPNNVKLSDLMNFIGKKNTVYSSNSNRTIQTAKLFSKEIFVEDTLNEIDYGDAEGMTLDKLQKKYPQIPKGWKQSKDPRFPNGENTKDVKNRMEEFLKKLQLEKGSNKLIITHNVFLRCLFGSLFNIPKENWHKIEIPHLEPFEILIAPNKNFYVNITNDQIKKIFKNLIPK